MRRRLELAVEKARVRRVPDGHEQAPDVDPPSRAAHGVLELESCDLVIAEHVGDAGIPQHAHLGMRQDAARHRLGRAEGVATMYDEHFAGKLRQIQRLFHRRVPTTDDSENAVAKEGKRTVAHGAGRYPTAPLGEPQLAVEAYPFRARASGDDHGVRLYDIAVVRLDANRSGRQLGAGDELRDHAHAVAQRLLLHPLHERRPADRFRKAGKVLDVGGEHELPSGNLHADRLTLEHQRVEAGAGRIDRRGPGRGTGADDDEILDPWYGHHSGVEEFRRPKPARRRQTI
ncbi:MAG: ABC-type sugar transport system, ATPase component [Gemmatimonadetes bacterium]|nr:ABC-type sugar transport system, ATPase component [Gemmatimonadota bacterium]